MIRILLIVFLTLIPSALLCAETPGEIVIEAIEQSLEVLRAPSLQGPEKTAQRKEKIREVLEPMFNFYEMSKRSLGRHWKNCTAEEREEFTQIFTDILRETYLDRSTSYSGEKIIYIRENTQNIRSKVQTNIITTEGKKISVDFSMIKNNNAWKIYDITIEGVSTVGNYRSQFNSILNESPFSHLIKELQKKQKEFADT
ncbi:MAG: ABC transporter substrate-binding protein [Candidatus Saelkia tenebricola]|nr:ABC transporter substrate-binding protein [Candidatus Saelkia tenebricola]